MQFLQLATSSFLRLSSSQEFRSACFVNQDPRKRTWNPGSWQYHPIGNHQPKGILFIPPAYPAPLTVELSLVCVIVQLAHGAEVGGAKHSLTPIPRDEPGSWECHLCHKSQDVQLSHVVGHWLPMTPARPDTWHTPWPRPVWGRKPRTPPPWPASGLSCGLALTRHGKTWNRPGGMLTIFI